MHGDTKHEKQGGWLTIEALIALTLVMLALPVVHSYYASYQLENTSISAAKHLQRIEQAVEGYTKANWANIVDESEPEKPFKVEQDFLEDEGFLPTDFKMTNPFGQTYNVYVVNPEDNSLVSVIVGEGGRPGTGVLKGAELKLATEVIPGTAKKVGLTGGVVPYSKLPGAAAGTIEGTGGSWTLDVSSWSGGGFSQPQQGALAAVNFYVSGAVNSDYLYRHDIGVPELNRMETVLDMGGNSINNIKDIVAEGRIRLEGDDMAGENAIEVASGDMTLADGNVYANDITFDHSKIWNGSGYVPTTASRAVYDMRLAEPGSTIHKPQCSGNANPQIFVSVAAGPVGHNMSVNTPSGNVSGSISSYRGRAENNGAEWKVFLDVYIKNATSPPTVADSGGGPNIWHTLSAGGGAQNSGMLMVGTKCT